MNKTINTLIVIICTVNLIYKLIYPQSNYAFLVFGFLIPYLVIRKGQIYKNYKKVYNLDTFKIKVLNLWHGLEILLTLEIYLCTPQFDRGLITGLTTNFGDNFIFSVIPCLLMYRFILYRSLELK